MITLPRTSREFIYVPGVTAFRDGEEADPTLLEVEMAFVAGMPTSSDWHPAEWVIYSTGPVIRCLVGPGGGVVLAPTKTGYSIWLRVKGSVEQPERPVGRLVIA